MTTARDSKATKMPLSNLLLVFCPSLNMNPPLLRVLCEAEGIWEEAPVLVIQREVDDVIDIRAESVEDGEEEYSDARDGTEEDDAEEESLQNESVGRTSEDVPSSVEYQASAEGVKVGTPSHVRSLDSRKPVFTIYLDTDDSSLLSQPVSAKSNRVRSGSSLKDDGSSDISDPDNASHSFVDGHSTSPPLLTSSAESDASTSTTDSSAHSSFADLPIPSRASDLYTKKAQAQGRSIPVIAEPPMELSPTTLRRPGTANSARVTGPIRFPTSSTDSHSPPATLGNRRSIPVLSLPNFSPPTFHSISTNTPQTPDSPSSPTPSMLGKRLKKPSLQLLFAKKSASSLRNVSSPVAGGKLFISGPYLQTPRPASDSSVSTPQSAVTAPQSSTFTLPPQLDTPIENSSLDMGLGLEGLDSPPDVDQPAQDEGEDHPRTSMSPQPPHVRLRESISTSSLSSSLAPGQGQTPIADRFGRSPSPGAKSTLSLVSPPDESETPSIASHLRPYPARARAASSSSSIASSNHLGILDDEEREDWTASVLMAADVDGDWSVLNSVR